MNNLNHDELLRILQAHGQQFLGSFSLPESQNSARKRKRTTEHQVPSERDVVSSEEEWSGIGSTSEVKQDLDEDAEPSEFGSEQEDDGFVAESSLSGRHVIVFSDSTPKKRERDSVSKVQMKAFMSSKVSKLREELATPSVPKSIPTDENLEEERTNHQNDALLHKLVHTELLSGSLELQLKLTPAQRRKALAGRVLELAGGAKLGKGETTIRKEERNNASKHVREGIAEKHRARQRQELEQAKNLGNYHPTLKKVFEASSTPTTRKRVRGLKMGVGTFKGGMLRLSQEDISTAERRLPTSTGSRSREKAHGRGPKGKTR